MQFTSKPSCLLITASWCPLSEHLIQINQQLIIEYKDKIDFIHSDYDDLDPLQRLRLNIKAVPLIRLLKDQEIKFQQYGGHLSRSELKALLHTYLQV